MRKKIASIILLVIMVLTLCSCGKGKDDGNRTVTFVSDGGTEISPAEVSVGMTVARPKDPQKTGYIFNVWTLNGVSYDFSQPVTEDIELKATYKEVVTVSFDTDGAAPMDAVQLAKGDVLTVPEKPVKDGYVFAWWALNGNEYHFNSGVTQNITLKAVYTKEGTHESEDDPSIDTALILQNSNPGFEEVKNFFSAVDALGRIAENPIGPFGTDADDGEWINLEGYADHAYLPISYANLHSFSDIEKLFSTIYTSDLIAKKLSGLKYDNSVVEQNGRLYRIADVGKPVGCSMGKQWVESMNKTGEKEISLTVKYEYYPEGEGWVEGTSECEVREKVFHLIYTDEMWKFTDYYNLWCADGAVH